MNNCDQTFFFFFWLYHPALCWMTDEKWMEATYTHIGTHTHTHTVADIFVIREHSASGCSHVVTRCQPPWCIHNARSGDNSLPLSFSLAEASVEVCGSVCSLNVCARLVHSPLFVESPQAHSASRWSSSVPPAEAPGPDWSLRRSRSSGPRNTPMKLKRPA